MIPAREDVGQFSSKIAQRSLGINSTRAFSSKKLSLIEEEKNARY